MTRFIDYVLDAWKINFHTTKKFQGFSKNEIEKMERELRVKFPEYFVEFLMEMGKTPELYGDDVIIDLIQIKEELQQESEYFLPHQLVFHYNIIVYPQNSYYIDLDSDPIDPLVYCIKGNKWEGKFSDFLFSEINIFLKKNDLNIIIKSDEYKTPISQVLDHLDYERINYPFTNTCVISSQSVAEFKKLLDWYLGYIVNASIPPINPKKLKSNLQNQIERLNPDFISSYKMDVIHDEQNVIKNLKYRLQNNLPLVNSLTWDQNGYQMQEDHITGLIINHLALSESEISEIFINLPFLRILGLSGCQSGKIPQSLQRLKYLEFLTLNANYITELPAEIGNLTNLRYLNLSFSRFTQLPEQIGNLAQLQDLRLYKTHLQNLPSTIKKLHHLQFLDIPESQIQVLPSEIGELTNLRFLGISYNQLKTLPDTFGNLYSLETLLCSHNQLEALPDTFGNLNYLKYCTFDHNQLKTLPQSLGKLARLRDFSAFHNRIESLPPEIGHLKRLRQLRLDHNQISQITPTLGNIRPLHYLNLGLNRITSIPQELTQLKYLRDLNILGNPVEPLPNWAIEWRSQHPNFRF